MYDSKRHVAKARACSSQLYLLMLLASVNSMNKTMLVVSGVTPTLDAFDSKVLDTKKLKRSS